MYILPPPNSKEYENFPTLESNYSSNQSNLMSIEEIKEMLIKISENPSD